MEKTKKGLEAIEGALERLRNRPSNDSENRQCQAKQDFSYWSNWPDWSDSSDFPNWEDIGGPHP